MHQTESSPSLFKRLDALCRSVESSWPNVIAGHENFALPRMMPEDTDTVIEVFFVPGILETAIIRDTFRERRAIWREFHCHVAIVCHDEETTYSHYLADVNYLMAARSSGAGFASVGRHQGNTDESPERLIVMRTATEVLSMTITDIATPVEFSYDLESGANAPVEIGSISWSTAA